MTFFLVALLIISAGTTAILAAIKWREGPAPDQRDPRYGRCTNCGTLTVWNFRIRAWVHCDERGSAITCKTPRPLPLDIVDRRLRDATERLYHPKRTRPEDWKRER